MQELGRDELIDERVLERTAEVAAGVTSRAPDLAQLAAPHSSRARSESSWRASAPTMRTR